MKDGQSPPASTPSRSRRAAKIALFALAFVIVAGLCLELFATSNVRLLRPSADPDLLFELKSGTYRWNGLWPFDAGWTLLRHDTLYTVDDNGCRVPATGTPQHVDVVLVGGVGGFGIGVPAEATIAGLLETRLKDFGAPATVANCSVPGRHLLASLHNAEIEVLRSHPRTVILLLEPDEIEGPEDISKIFNPESGLHSWLYDHIAFFRLAYQGQQLLQLRKGLPLDPQQLSSQLTRFSSVMKDNGVKPYFVVVDANGDARSDLLGDAAARLSIPVVIVPDKTHHDWEGKDYLEVADALARVVTGREVAVTRSKATEPPMMPPPTSAPMPPPIPPKAAPPGGTPPAMPPPATPPIAAQPGGAPSTGTSPPNAAQPGGTPSSGKPPDAPTAGTSHPTPGGH